MSSSFVQACSLATSLGELSNCLLTQIPHQPIIRCRHGIIDTVKIQVTLKVANTVFGAGELYLIKRPACILSK